MHSPRPARSFYASGGKGYFALRRDPLLPTAAKVGKNAVQTCGLKIRPRPAHHAARRCVPHGRGRTKTTRNVELTNFSAHCRFYSEMRWCAVLLNWRCLARKKTPYGVFFMSPCKYLRIFAARSPVLPVSASGLQAPPQMPYTSPAKPIHPLSPQRVRDTLSCNPPY